MVWIRIRSDPQLLGITETRYVIIFQVSKPDPDPTILTCNCALSEILPLEVVKSSTGYIHIYLFNLTAAYRSGMIFQGRIRIINKSFRIHNTEEYISTTVKFATTTLLLCLYRTSPMIVTIMAVCQILPTLCVQPIMQTKWNLT